MDRSNAQAALAFARFQLDPAAFELRRDGRRVAVEPRVLELIIYLACNAGRLVPRDELLAQVWRSREVSDWALARAVKHARRVLGDSDRCRAIIETVRGRGLRWRAPLQLVPVEARDRRATVDAFVGRDDLFEWLDPLLEAARSGRRRPSVLILSGPPGIGKTRALDALAARADSRGFTALVARCPEDAGSAPYHAWTRLLQGAGIGRLAQRLPADAVRSLVQAMPVLGAVLNLSVGPPVTALDDTSVRFRLRIHLSLALRMLARGPLLLCFDDLDRADSASLDLLRAILEEADDGFALLASCRQPRSPSTPEASAALGAIERLAAARPPLRGLDLPAVQSLAETAWGSARAQAMAPALLDRTGGNPFFLRQVLATGASTSLPRSVEAAVLKHLRELPPRCTELLRFGALQGRSFELRLLAACALLDADAVEAALSAAHERGLIDVERPGLQMRFEHALVCEVLVRSLPQAQQRVQHRRLADALAAAGRPWSLIAHHRCAGAGGDPDALRQAVEACIEAAREACACHAAVEALRHCEAAVERLPAAAIVPGMQLRLLLVLGEAQIGANRLEAGRRTLLQAMDLARDAGDANAFAAAALLFAGREETPYVDELRVRRLDEALRRLPRRDSVLRTRVMARLAEALCLDRDARRRDRIARTAVRIATRLGDATARCVALRGLHLAGRFGADVPGRLRVARAELGAALDSGDPILIRDARSDTIGDLLDLGHRAALDLDLARFHRLAQQVPEPLILWFETHYEAMRHLLCGDDAAAEAAMECGLGLGSSTGYELAMQWYAMQLYQLRRDQERPELFDGELSRLAREHPETPWGLAAALRAAELGDRAQATGVLRSVVDSRRLRLPQTFLWRYSAGLVAELACVVGDPGALRVLQSALRPHAGLQRAIYGLVHAGSVDQVLGRLAAALGDWTGARHHHARALAQARRLGALRRQVEALEARAAANAALRRTRSADRDLADARAIRARLLVRGT